MTKSLFYSKYQSTTMPTDEVGYLKKHLCLMEVKPDKQIYHLHQKHLKIAEAIGGDQCSKWQIIRINEGLCFIIIMYNTSNLLLLFFYSVKSNLTKHRKFNHCLKCFYSNWMSWICFNSLGGVEAAEWSGLGSKPPCMFYTSLRLLQSRSIWSSDMLVAEPRGDTSFSMESSEAWPNRAISNATPNPVARSPCKDGIKHKMQGSDSSVVSVNLPCSYLQFLCFLEVIFYILS